LLWSLLQQQGPSDVGAVVSVLLLLSLMAGVLSLLKQ
jgi:hypothetical protein